MAPDLRFDTSVRLFCEEDIQVIVATPQEACVAHYALDTEGIEHEVKRCDGPYGYGELLEKLWTVGDGFILVEHDIAPWPGAIHQLIGCDDDWCCYEYPLNFGLVGALGCTKFSTKLLAKTWRIPQLWYQTHWGAVDGKLVAALRTAHGQDAHIHTPPVAHARVN